MKTSLRSSWPLVLALCAWVVVPLRAEAAPAQSDPTAAAPSAAPTTEAAEPAASAAAADQPSVAAEPLAAPPPATATEAPAEASGGFWAQVFVPMGQRLATALPVTLKAVLLLLLFWVVAVIAGGAVRRLLTLTDWDNRMVREWGLEGLLKTESGEVRSLEKLSGGVVKWVILAFGFIAFFQALELSMVAGPLQNVANAIVGAIPRLLQAAVILLAYWVLATIVRVAIGRTLGAFHFDERAAKLLPPREIAGESVAASGQLSRLFFYVVLLFGLPPFLDALGQRSLVAPLSRMLEKGLGFLPNLFAAALLLFIGRIVATVVREVVTSFLAATGLDAGAERLGRILESRKLSGVAGTVAYFLIMIPVIVAAVDSLGIRAISDPVRAALEQVVAAVPLMFVAVVLVFIGYFVATALRDLTESFLSGVGMDALPTRLGLHFLRPQQGQASLSRIGGMVVMVVILLITAQQATATLGLNQLAGLVGGLLAFLPQLFAGLFVILASLSLADYVARLVAAATAGSEQSAVVVGVARYAIVFLGFSMGLAQLGVGREVVSVAVGATFGGVALAVGLAFGLGGRERAKQIIEKAGEGR
jgi:Mechanosensitive ion channel, conserved TM helix